MGSRNLLGQTISSLCLGTSEVQHTKKLCGIEVEVEGSSLIFKSSKYWNLVPDGSLRSGMEYVSIPHPVEESGFVINELAAVTQKARFIPSIRTSVHFHYNVQYFTLQQLFNVLVVYSLLENCLVELNGADRKGNLFCLRIKDADFLIQQLRSSLKFNKEKMLRIFNNDTRYASLNLSALSKFGTVEYRFIKGTTDWKLIENWANALSHVTYYSSEWLDTTKIINHFKKIGTEVFVREFTTPWLFKEIQSLPNWQSLVEENLGIVYGLVLSIEQYKAQNSKISIFSENDDDEDHYKFLEKAHVTKPDIDDKYGWNTRDIGNAGTVNFATQTSIEQIRNMQRMLLNNEAVTRRVPIPDPARPQLGVPPLVVGDGDFWTTDDIPTR